jgi:predicted enzyme related to lactoylglutathione lyase
MRFPLRHAAVNADDLEATVRFYEGVFGWSFVPYGPPGFVRCEVGDGQVVAIQQRRELVPGVRTTGLECTFDVADLGAVAAAAQALGGSVAMAPVTLPGVGDLAFVVDPSGNPVGAMAR